MSGRRWAVADGAAIPSLWNVGRDGVAIAEDEAFALIEAGAAHEPPPFALDRAE